MGSYFDRGNDKYQKGDYNGAIKDFSEAIRLNPDYATAYYSRGICKAELQDLKGAIGDYSRAIRLNPDYAYAYNARGVSEALLQNHKGAIEDYNQAIRLNPDYVGAYSNRGISKDSLQNHKGAIEDYNQAIRLSPEDDDAYSNRGISKKSLQDYKGAIEDYNQAIRLNPDNAGAYYNRGNSKRWLKDYKGAIEDYSQTIRLKPDYADAYHTRGTCKEQLKDYKGAIEDYSYAIELKPDYVEAYNNRGNIKDLLKDYEGAIEDYNQTIRLKPDYAEAYNNRGLSKGQLQDYNGAQQDFLTALSIPAQPSPLCIFNLAKLYLNMGHKEEALQMYIEGVKCFKQETEASLKMKFKLSDGNIHHIKSSINKFENLMKQTEGIKRQASILSRTDVLQQLVKVNADIASVSIKSADEKANQNQTDIKHKALEEQIKEMRKKLQEHDKRIVTVQKEVGKLKEKVEQMAKYIYADQKILEKIDQIDSRSLSEFYKLLYNMLINHFMAYRMISTGFFRERMREATTFDKIVGRVCRVQPIIEKIPIFGVLAGIPFQILDMVIEEKSSRLNSIIAEKINQSKLQSEARITSYMSYLFETLIKDQPLNKRLLKSIQEKEASFLSKAMDAFGQLKEKIYSNVFGGTSHKFSYVQQAVIMYMARFTLQLYEVKKDEFQQHCKSKESFSDFFSEFFRQM